MSSKAREALKKLVEIIEEKSRCSPLRWYSCAFDMLPLKDAKAALDEPVRNCDVGTIGEQADRFHKFCASNSSGIDGMCNPNCPCISVASKIHCLCLWSQMPYKKEDKE